MRRAVPRILLAGTSSGCGKTTVSCAVLQALVNRGLSVAAFKCGPDYIDPMFHSRIIGAESRNLDSFFFSENTLRYLLAENSKGKAISVLEGVMGYYDGMGADSTRASSYEIAGITRSPAVLIVDARGAALSVLAAVDGFVRFRPRSRIRGVILNRCSGGLYPSLAKLLRERYGERLLPLGYLPELRECTLHSRHLGLITAEETEGLREKMQRLAEEAEKTVDLDGLLRLANTAAALEYREVPVKEKEPIRIGVARDRAFCFLL